MEKIKGNCEKCFKEVEEVFEINDEYICESCLDDRNNHFELLRDMQNGK